MKKTSLLSKLFLGTAVVALSFGVASCKGDKPEDSKEAAEDQNENKFDETSKDSLEDDSDYMVKAAESDLKEIELGKLAQTKSSNADVKALGKMMVDAHTKSFEELKKASSAKNISIPLTLTDKGSEAYSELNEKSGNDFDKAYADKMVDGHKKMIEKMEEAAKDAKDPEIKQWAANMIPTLQAHLQHAETVKTKVDAIK